MQIDAKLKQRKRDIQNELCVIVPACRRCRAEERGWSQSKPSVLQLHKL